MKTKRYSYILELLSFLVIACIVADFFIKWSYIFGAYTDVPDNFFTRMLEQQYATTALQHHTWTLFGLITLDSLSVFLLTFGLLHFIQLLHLYRTSHSIFSREALTLYKKVCWYALLWTLFNPLQSMLVSLLLTIHNPPGQRVLAVTLQSRDIAYAFIVGFFYFVAYIMQEALAIKQENDLTV